MLGFVGNNGIQSLYKSYARYVPVSLLAINPKPQTLKPISIYLHTYIYIPSSSLVRLAALGLYMRKGAELRIKGVQGFE